METAYRGLARFFYSEKQARVLWLGGWPSNTVRLRIDVAEIEVTYSECIGFGSPHGGRSDAEVWAYTPTWDDAVDLGVGALSTVRCSPQVMAEGDEKT